MKSQLRKIEESGFSLVELLVVMVIMGLVVTAIYSLSTSTHRTTNTSEEVIEVQQNLRIGLDVIARDLLMAGFLSNTDPITMADDDQITLTTASAFGRYAQVSANMNWTGANHTLTVDPAEAAAQFSGGNWVRIIRPADGCQPLDLAGCGGSASPILVVAGVGASSLTLAAPAAPATPVAIRAGDMIVRVPTTSNDFPNTVTYTLSPVAPLSNVRLLQRSVNGEAPENIAEKVTGLTLQYINKDGGVEAAMPVPGLRLPGIVAVRVQLTGATDINQTGMANYSGVKTRQLQTVITMRNRMGGADG